jgi:hypothetical protein
LAINNPSHRNGGAGGSTPKKGKNGRKEELVEERAANSPGGNGQGSPKVTFKNGPDEEVEGTAQKQSKLAKSKKQWKSFGHGTSFLTYLNI